MAKRGSSSWNKKFGEIARSCFKETSGGSMRSYGTCMSTELRAARPGKRKKAKKSKKR